MSENEPRNAEKKWEQPIYRCVVCEDTIDKYYQTCGSVSCQVELFGESGLEGKGT